MIKLTDQEGNHIHFPVDIAFRPKGNGTEIKWNGSLYEVKESHEEVSEKLLDFRDKRHRKYAINNLK